MSDHIIAQESTLFSLDPHLSVLDLEQIELLMEASENDPEFLAINPGGFIPALVDGETTMVESIAIMEYLMGRYGPTPMAPDPQEAQFGLYQQFLHLGEAGLATPMFMRVVSDILAPEAEKDNWGGRKGLQMFEGRLRLVTRQLARAPWMAGEAFTAADISITYALQFAQRTVGFQFGEAELAYIARTTARPAYARAMDTCQATKAWAEEVSRR